MDQFTVPQFIEAEDKILGPLTARQFVELLVTVLVLAVLFKVVPFVWFIVTGVPFFAVGVVLTFVPINGQPFHFFLLNLIQTFKRPRLRVWDKQLNTAELYVYMKKETPPPPELIARKEPMARSRLQELTLVVNTGGVYKPE